MTHRGVDCELVRLRDLVVQLPGHSDDTSGTVDGKERRRGLEGVEDTAPRAQVGIGGVDDEDGCPHRRVLGKSKVNRRMSFASPEAAASASHHSSAPRRPLTAPLQPTAPGLSFPF